MPAVVVVGAQWGDEGKGKFVDYLAAQADLVVRSQGGPNAGHTVVVDDRVYKLHQIPSGVLYPGKLCLIGHGVVLDPPALVQELDYLAERGIERPNLRISPGAHLIMPYHIRLDGADEDRRGERRIGTTRRGVGPAYMDKFARVGLRVADLLDPATFLERLSAALSEKNALLQHVHGLPGFERDEIAEAYLAAAERLRPYVAETTWILADALDAGRRVLFEGAQGTLLDIDFGTYPYVTSSHPIAGGACVGAGVGPTRIDYVLGIVKAYTSRVGDGPFPTELTDATGDRIRELGHEYGTTTGRPRRVGWLDAVMVRYAAKLSGFSGLAVPHLDTLGALPAARMCVGYRVDGKVTREFPTGLAALARCEPVYEEFAGWGSDLAGTRSFADLPPSLRAYLNRLSEIAEVPVAMISIGRERTQTLVFAQPFETAGQIGQLRGLAGQTALTV